MHLNLELNVIKPMNALEELRLEAKTRFYHHIIAKLNATIQEYHNLAAVAQFYGAFELPEQITVCCDGQINHLLAITVRLVNKVPGSPHLEELFTNFMKDYLHLVNPELPFHAGDLYINRKFIQEVSPSAPVVKLEKMAYAMP
ncbi:MAG: hypothetical protein JWQ14_1463 [Adhaeribacter sp.]|nr:hypothetical protein [Adhaeribacter sp.]